MSLYEQFAQRVRENLPVALASDIDGPHIGSLLLVTPEGAQGGTLGNAELDRVVARDTQGELEAGRTSVRHYGPQGQTTPEDLHNTPTVRVFIDTFSPPPMMVIFGAVDFTAALARVAKVLGYHVVVCDAREGIVELDAALADWSVSGEWQSAHRAERENLDAFITSRIADDREWPPSYAQLVGLVHDSATPADYVLTAAGGLPGELNINWRSKGIANYDYEYDFSS